MIYYRFVEFQHHDYTDRYLLKHFIIESDLVDLDSFWQKIVLAVISKAFTRSNLKLLNIKPNLHYCAPYIGKKIKRCSNILNTEHQKVQTDTEKNIENDNCREMSEERLLEMLSNDTFRKFNSAAKTCKVSTVGSKMDIIMRIKAAALKDGKKICKIFSKIWGHSGGRLSFSCPHGVVYYLKFSLQSESSCDYVHGLLSMEHLPNITVIDMAYIVAKHALVSRKEYVMKYVYDQNGILFKPYSGSVAVPENPENVANPIENRLEVSFPWICQHHQSKIP